MNDKDLDKPLWFHVPNKLAVTESSCMLLHCASVSCVFTPFSFNRIASIEIPLLHLNLYVTFFFENIGPITLD